MSAVEYVRQHSIQRTMSWNLRAAYVWLLFFALRRMYEEAVYVPDWHYSPNCLLESLMYYNLLGCPKLI